MGQGLLNAGHNLRLGRKRIGAAVRAADNQSDLMDVEVGVEGLTVSLHKNGVSSCGGSGAAGGSDALVFCCLGCCLATKSQPCNIDNKFTYRPLTARDSDSKPQLRRGLNAMLCTFR